MPSPNVPPPKVPQLNLKEVEDVNRREELEEFAYELSALKGEHCDESKVDAPELFCKVLGDASVTCVNAAAENPVTINSYKNCKTLYKAANRILENPKDTVTIDFAKDIPDANDEYYDDFEKPEDDDYHNDFEESEDDDYDNDFEEDYLDDFKTDNPSEGYSIELVKGNHAKNNDYLRRLTPGLQSTKLKIEGNKATLGPFFSKEEEKKAMSELFDGNTNYNKSSSGLWMVNGRRQDKNLDSDWFLKTKRVSVADKSTVSSLGTAKKGQPVRKQGQPVRKQGGKTRNRRHRRKSAKSSSKRIPRVVTKKHRRNRKTRKGKRKEKK